MLHHPGVRQTLACFVLMSSDSHFPTQMHHTGRRRPPHLESGRDYCRGGSRGPPE